MWYDKLIVYKYSLYNEHNNLYNVVLPSPDFPFI